MSSPTLDPNTSSGYPADTTATEQEETELDENEDGSDNGECGGETLLLDAKTIPLPIRLGSRRRTLIDELRERVPIPPTAVPTLHYPSWPTMPLDHKLPGGVPAPRGSVIFARGILGSKIHRRPRTYTIYDPKHQHRVITDYESLHDPHARGYLCKPTVKSLLLKQGLITPDGQVKCSLKQFNHYREYLSTIYNQCLEEYIQEHDNRWRKAFECDRELQQYAKGKRTERKRRSILEKLRKRKGDEYRRLRAKQERDEQRRNAFEKARYLRNVQSAMQKGQESIRRRIKVNRALYRRRVLDQILFRAVMEKDAGVNERIECSRSREAEQRNLFLTEWAIAKCVNQLQRMRTDDLVERSLRHNLKEKVCKRLDITNRKCYALFPFRECRAIYEARLKKDKDKQEERVLYLMRKYFYVWLNKVRYSCRIDAAHTSLWNIQEELRRDAVLMCNFCEQTCPPHSAVEAIMKLRPQRNLFGGVPANPPQLEQQKAEKSEDEPTVGTTSSANLNSRKPATAPAQSKQEVLTSDCVLCLPLSKRAKSAGSTTLFGIEKIMKCTRYGVLKPHKVHPCECGPSPGSAYSTLIKFWKQQKTHTREHLCGKCITDITVPKFCIPAEYASRRTCQPFAFPTCPPTNEDYSPCYPSQERRCETQPQIARKKSTEFQRSLREQCVKGNQLSKKERAIQSVQAQRSQFTQEGQSKLDRGIQGRSVRRAENEAQTAQSKRNSTATGDGNVGTSATSASTTEPAEDECFEEGSKVELDQTESGMLASRYKAGPRKRVKCKSRLKMTSSRTITTSTTRVPALSGISSSASAKGSPWGSRKGSKSSQKDSPTLSAKVGITTPGKSAGISTEATPTASFGAGQDVRASGTQLSSQSKTSESSGPSVISSGTASERVPQRDSAEGGTSPSAASTSTEAAKTAQVGSQGPKQQKSSSTATNISRKGSKAAQYDQLPRPPHSAPAATSTDTDDDRLGQSSQTSGPLSSSAGTGTDKGKSASVGTPQSVTKGTGVGPDGTTSSSAQAGENTRITDQGTSSGGPSADFSATVGPTVDNKGVGGRPLGVEISTGASPEKQDGTTVASPQAVHSAVGASPDKRDGAVGTVPLGSDKSATASPTKGDASVATQPAGVDKAGSASPLTRDGTAGTQQQGLDKSATALLDTRDGTSGTQAQGLDKSATALPGTREDAAGGQVPGQNKSAAVSPATTESGIAAQPDGAGKGITAEPRMKDSSAQGRPDRIGKEVSAAPITSEASADGQPRNQDQSTGASVGISNAGSSAEATGTDKSSAVTPSKQTAGATTEATGISVGTGAKPDTMAAGVATERSAGQPAGMLATPAAQSGTIQTEKPNAADVGIGTPVEADGTAQTPQAEMASSGTSGSPGASDASQTDRPAKSVAATAAPYGTAEDSQTEKPGAATSGTAMPGPEERLTQTGKSLVTSSGTGASTGIDAVTSPSGTKLIDAATGQPITTKTSGTSTELRPDKSTQVNTVATPTQAGMAQTDGMTSVSRERVDKVVSTTPSKSRISPTRVLPDSRRSTISRTTSALRQSPSRGSSPPPKKSTSALRQSPSPGSSPPPKKSISFVRKAGSGTLPVQSLSRGSIRQPTSRPSSAPASAKPSTIIQPLKSSQLAALLPEGVRSSIAHHLVPDESRPLMRVELPKRYTSLKKTAVDEDEAGAALVAEMDPSEHIETKYVSGRPSVVQPRPSTAKSRPSTAQSRPSTAQSRQSTVQSRPSTTLSRPSIRSKDGKSGEGTAHLGELPWERTVGTGAFPPDVGTIPNDQIPQSALRDDVTGTNNISFDRGGQTGLVPLDDPCLNNVTQTLIGDVIGSVATDLGLPENDFDPCCLDEQAGRPICPTAGDTREICCTTCAVGSGQTPSVRAPMLPTATKATTSASEGAEVQTDTPYSKQTRGGQTSSTLETTTTQSQYVQGPMGSGSSGSGASPTSSRIIPIQRLSSGSGGSVGKEVGSAGSAGSPIGLSGALMGPDGRTASTGQSLPFAQSAGVGIGSTVVPGGTSPFGTDAFGRPLNAGTGVPFQSQITSSPSQGFGTFAQGTQTGMPYGGFGSQAPQVPILGYGSQAGGPLAPGFGPKLGPVPAQWNQGIGSNYGAQVPSATYGSQAGAPGQLGPGMPGFGTYAGGPTQSVPRGFISNTGQSGQQLVYPPGEGLATQTRPQMQPYGSQVGSVPMQAYSSQYGPSAPYGTQAFPPNSQQFSQGIPLTQTRSRSKSPFSSGYPAGGTQDELSGRTGTLPHQYREYAATGDELKECIPSDETFADTAAPYKQQLVARTMAQMRSAAAQHPLAPMGDNPQQTMPPTGRILRKLQYKDGKVTSTTSLSELRGPYRGCCAEGPLMPICDENLPMIDEIYLNTRQVTPISDLLADRALRRAINDVAGPCDPEFFDGPPGGPPDGTKGPSRYRSDGTTPRNFDGISSKTAMSGDDKSSKPTMSSQSPGEVPCVENREQITAVANYQTACGASYEEIRVKIETLKSKLLSFKQQLSKQGVQCPTGATTGNDSNPPPPPPLPQTFQSYTVETVITSMGPAFADDTDNNDSNEVTPPPLSMSKKAHFQEYPDTTDDLTVSSDEKRKFLESAGFSLANSPDTSSVQILFPQRKMPFDVKTIADPDTITMLLNQADAKDRTEIRGRIDTMRAQLEHTRQSLRHRGIIPDAGNISKDLVPEDQENQKRKSKKNDNEPEPDTKHQKSKHKKPRKH